MDQVEPTFSLEASDSQSGCGSSHTSVISAIVATILWSSTVALRNFFGKGDTSDFSVTLSGGPGDLGLVGLTGVVTHGSGGVECVAVVDDDDDDAPPGFGTPNNH